MVDIYCKNVKIILCGGSMNQKIFDEIKNSEELIEEKRLAIKDIKKEKAKLHDLMDITSNIYEYLAAPLCAISITLAALFSGPIIYVLPILMSAIAIGISTSKFIIRRKVDKLNVKMSELKDQRQKAYKNREEIYENIFNNLAIKKLDDKDYYHQIVNASNECDKLTDSMIPYKEKRKKLIKSRNIISRIFDYVLAPVTTIVVPLVCSLTGIGVVSQVALMGLSSATLLGCASVDNHLTRGIDNLSYEINSIKSDRTVKYVKRDIKLEESLNYLKAKKDLLLQKKQYEPVNTQCIKKNNDNKAKKR